MELPILSYGHAVLRQKCVEVSSDYPQLDQLIEAMWKTMDHADGAGLAAPQIGKPLKLFIIDSRSAYDNIAPEDRAFYFDEDDRGISETFINARIIDYSSDVWEDDEGCLSIPSLFYKVKRSWSVTIEYWNRNLQNQLKTFSGKTARIIQHEYDHTEGILYIDHINPLIRRLIESKLKKISKGHMPVNYPMVYIK